MDVNELANMVVQCFKSDSKTFFISKANYDIQKKIEAGSTSKYEVGLIAFGLLASWGCSRKHIDHEMNILVECLEAREFFPLLKKK